MVFYVLFSKEAHFGRSLDSCNQQPANLEIQKLNDFNQIS